MKKVFISYANDVTDLTTVLDFHNVILKLKSAMMDRLSFTQNVTHFNVVNTTYDKIIEDTEFSDEMIRMYNNILFNKLDDDDIDNNNNNNDVNTNNLVSNLRKSMKIKYNDDPANENNDVNTKNVYPILRKSRKRNCKLSSSKHLNQKLNDKNMSPLIQKTSISESNNKKNNTKTIDDVTPEKEYDDTINNVSAESMSGELLIIIQLCL